MMAHWNERNATPEAWYRHARLDSGALAQALLEAAIVR